MTFDKGSRVLVGKKYEYVEDPKIDYAESGNSANSVNKVPKGISSGGVNITVVGLNFNYIQVGSLIHFYAPHFYYGLGRKDCFVSYSVMVVLQRFLASKTAEWKLPIGC